MKIIILFVGLLAVTILLGGSALYMTGVIDKLAKAIARAEGFYVTGSRPARNHNPGNMTQDLINKATGKDGPFVVYANDTDGFENLRRQLWLAWGGSAIYNPTMTIAEFASHWTTTQQTIWAQNVATALGVTTDTQLQQLT